MVRRLSGEVGLKPVRTSSRPLRDLPTDAAGLMSSVTLKGAQPRALSTNTQGKERVLIESALDRSSSKAKADPLNAFIASLQLSATCCPRGVVLLFNRSAAAKSVRNPASSFGYVQLSTAQEPAVPVTLRTRRGVACGTSPESIFMDLQQILVGHLDAGLDLRDHFGSLIAAAICILAERYQWCFSTQRRRRAGGLARWQEDCAKAYMVGRIGESFAVESVAALCGMSAPHFSRAFKISTGLPPYRWLVKRRIQHAKELLTAGPRSLADISMECGFSEQSHFTNAFRREAGMTPGAWRRTHRPKKTTVLPKPGLDHRTLGDSLAMNVSEQGESRHGEDRVALSRWVDSK